MLRASGCSLWCCMTSMLSLAELTTDDYLPYRLYLSPPNADNYVYAALSHESNSVSGKSFTLCARISNPICPGPP